MSKITDYTRTNAIGGGDVLLLDGTAGTRTVTGQNAANSLLQLAGGAKESQLMSSISTLRFEKPGWYRLFQSSEHHTHVLNGQLIGDLAIERSYSTVLPEVHRILVGIVDDRIAMKSVIDVSKNKILTKIRAYEILDSNANTWTGCIDIFYNADTYSYIQAYLLFNKSSYGIPWNGLISSTIVNANLPDVNITEHTFKSNSYMDGPDTWPLS